MSASSEIDANIAGIGGWKGERMAEVRKLVHEVDPDVIVEIKWRKPSNPNGVPVWSHDGILFTGETYRDKVKLTFAHGAAFEDPAGLFNASLGGNARRAIDFFEEDKINKDALKALLSEAVAYNVMRSAMKSKGSKASKKS